MRPGHVILAAVGVLIAAGCADATAPASGPERGEVVRALAARGDAEAQVTLGWMYETGRGVAEDPATAAQWYRESAVQGNALAQYALAELYARGAGVEQDYGAAARWYLAAADAGNASAEYKLGFLYEQGLGVRRDYRTAARWYERAGQRWRNQSTLPPGAERVAGPPVVALVLTPPVPRSARTAAPAPAGAPDTATPSASPTSPASSASSDDSDRAVGEAPAAEPAQIAPTARDEKPRWLHLASFRTKRGVARQWDELRQAQGDILGDYRARLVRVDLGETLGAWVRLNLGPFADAATARALCRRLKERDVYCRLLPR